MGLSVFLIEQKGRIALLLIQHLYLFLISMLFALMIGVSVALLVTRPHKERIGSFILSLTAATQSIPPIAVIAIVFIFVGVGGLPAIIALVLYSLVPIIFNTTSGLLNVPSDVIEAARGTGFTNRQILLWIKIPLSTQIIMAGIRNAATINIGTATVASFIGGGGLGDLIFMGLKLYRTDMIVIGALLVATLAILIDKILKRIELGLIPIGLRRLQCEKAPRSV
jgi:osmoprotectant transport system permease protein